ncbi:MAG: hypothetical protein IPO27_07865 [Bacteroidetes bacterium]|nr:hypothetical protein [Bacteroidota bacterium]
MISVLLLVNSSVHSQCSVINNPPQTINVNTIINAPQIYNEDIIVDGNSLLEIYGPGTISFAPGKGIIVKSGSTLYAEGVTLANSQTCMWSGITLQGNPSNQFGSGGTCELSDVIILNANIGVDVGKGGSLASLYSTFDANYIGIRLGDGLGYNAISFAMGGTHFTCTNNLIIPYQNQMPNSNPGTRSFAGILSTEIGTLFTSSFLSGYNNTFNNLNCGIISNSENLIVADCSFENIKNYDNYFNLLSNGCGILINGNLDDVVTITGLGISSIMFPKPLTFNNCFTGVRFERANVKITQCQMDYMTNGVIGLLPVSSCSIYGNHMNCENDGIVVTQADLCTNTQISQNKIKLDIQAGSIWGFGTGIDYSALANTSTTTDISNNNINVYKGVEGIVVTNIGIASPLPHLNSTMSINYKTSNASNQVMSFQTQNNKIDLPLILSNEMRNVTIYEYTGRVVLRDVEIDIQKLEAQLTSGIYLLDVVDIKNKHYLSRIVIK